MVWVPAQSRCAWGRVLRVSQAWGIGALSVWVCSRSPCGLSSHSDLSLQALVTLNVLIWTHYLNLSTNKVNNEGNKMLPNKFGTSEEDR